MTTQLTAENPDLLLRIKKSLAKELEKDPIDFKAIKELEDMRERYERDLADASNLAITDKVEVDTRTEAERYTDEFQQLLVKDYAYISESDKFVNRHTKALIAPSALTRMVAHLKHSSVKASAINVHTSSPEAIKTDAHGTFFTNEEVFNYGGRAYYNTWIGTQSKTKQGDVSQWLKLVEFIAGSEADTVLDFLAYSVQYPMKKIRWSILVMSRMQGNGKTFLFRPISEIFGSAFGEGKANDFKGRYDDFKRGKKFVVFEELEQASRYETLDTIKTMISNTGLDSLNIKGTKYEQQLNVYSIFMTSNNTQPLNIDKNDRRIWPIDAPETKLDASFYDELNRQFEQEDLSDKVHHYLLHRDLSNFTPDRPPARYNATRERLVEGSMPDYLRAIKEASDMCEDLFERKFFRVDDVRDWLKAKNYTQHGRSAVAAFLRDELGYNVIELKPFKLEGKTVRVPVVYSKTVTEAQTTQSEVYDYIKDIDDNKQAALK